MLSTFVLQCAVDRDAGFTMFLADSLYLLLRLGSE